MGRRRMPGEGSVYQRADGKWVAQVSSGMGQDRRYERRIRRTKREAHAALDDLREERRSGLEPSRLDLGSYLRWWLQETVAPVRAANTTRGYEDAIAHFEPIAHIPLIDLRAEHIEATCNRMLAVKGHTVRAASPKTIRNAQLMLRAALEQAVMRGYIRRNEAKLVKLREVRAVRKPALTRDLARAILDAVKGDRYEAAYALGLAGLRAGEFLGLTRADVDLDAGRVTIRHQLQGSGEGARIVPTKTTASAETVDLPAFVLSRLRAHIQKHDPVALIFVTESGYAVNGSWLTKHFQALLRAADLPHLTIHELRGGAGSLLAAMGAHPSVARDFLRHSNVKTTLTHYSRTTDAQRREAAHLLDEALR